jgi:TolB-like protein
VFIKQQNGEFILSRDIRKLANDINVNYVVVGTYTVIEGNVYVNLKIIDPKTDVIKSSVDYIVPLASSF